MKPSGPKPPAMADGTEFDPDDVQALREWMRGDLKEGSARDLRALRTLAQMLRYAKPLDLGRAGCSPTPLTRMARAICDYP